MISMIAMALLAAEPTPKLRLAVGTVAEMKGSAQVLVFEQRSRPLARSDVDRLKLYVGDRIRVTVGATVRVRQANGLVQTLTHKPQWQTLKRALNSREAALAKELSSKTRGAVSKGQGTFQWPSGRVLSSAHFLIIEPDIPGTSEFTVTQRGAVVWSGKITRVDGAFQSAELNAALDQATRSPSNELTINAGGRTAKFTLISRESEASLDAQLKVAAKIADPLLRELAEIKALSDAKQTGPASWRLDQLKKQTQ